MSDLYSNFHPQSFFQLCKLWLTLSLLKCSHRWHWAQQWCNSPWQFKQRFHCPWNYWGAFLICVLTYLLLLSQWEFSNKLSRAPDYYSKGILPKYYIKFVSVCFKNGEKINVFVLVLIVPLLLRLISFRLTMAWWKHLLSVCICTDFFLVSECLWQQSCGVEVMAELMFAVLIYSPQHLPHISEDFSFLWY